MEQVKISEQIEEFLSLLRSIDKKLPYYETELDTENAASSDLLHYIELEQPSASQMIKVYKKQQENRRTRRWLKDQIELFKPVFHWKKRHAQACKELEDLLGVIRKVEHSHATRAYAIKTHILDDLTDKHHLMEKTSIEKEDASQ